MRKDAAKRTDWVKHTRNAATGKRGHNKRVRKNLKHETKKVTADTMIHKQWKVTVILDVLAHTEPDAKLAIAAANHTLRNVLYDNPFDVGVNVSAIFSPDNAQSVTKSGIEPQIDMKD